ncbi:MAG: hypothetical protein WCK90_00040 [archaeon]
MERQIGDRNILDEFTTSFCDIVNKHAKYIIVSGFVAIAHARTRGTEDIDMIMEKVDLSKFLIIHSELKKKFDCLQSSIPEEVYDYLNRGISVRYVRKGTTFPPEMEVKFAKDELDEMQIKMRQKFPFTRLDVWFSTIESNIAFKEELLKSDKDMEDARHLRIIYKDKLDEKLINDVKDKIRKLRLN